MRPPASAYSRILKMAGIACRVASVASWRRRLAKNGSGPTTSASALLRTSVLKAASISRLLLASTTSICNPMADAAAATSLVADAGRGDHGDLPANQFSRQRRQPVILIFGPAKFDRHILPFDEARLFQALPKSGDVWRIWTGRCGSKKPNNRHGRLLRARRARPCGYSAAEKCDEVPPPHGAPQGQGSRTKYSRCWSGS